MLNRVQLQDNVGIAQHHTISGGKTVHDLIPQVNFREFHIGPFTSRAHEEFRGRHIIPAGDIRYVSRH
jgi:hypothetical protein